MKRRETNQNALAGATLETSPAGFTRAIWWISAPADAGGLRDVNQPRNTVNTEGSEGALAELSGRVIGFRIKVRRMPWPRIAGGGLAGLLVPGADGQRFMLQARGSAEIR